MSQEINDLLKDIKESLNGVNDKIDKQNEKIVTLENKISSMEGTKKEILDEDDGEYFSYKEDDSNMAAPEVPPPPPPKEKNIFKEQALKATHKIEDALRMDSYVESEPTPPTPPSPDDDFYNDEPSIIKEHQHKSVAEKLDALYDRLKTKESVEELDVKEYEDKSIEKNKKKEVEKETLSLEEIIGGKWFLKIGVVVIVIGMAFFFKYAFENYSWITDTVKIAMGLLAGLVMLGIGEMTIRKYSLYGQIVSGGGLVMLYLSFYAAQNFYHLGFFNNPFMTAFCMGIVTAIGIVLSIRYDAPSMIIAATLGGFATPFLVSDGQNNQSELFTYITILDLAILGVSFFKNWRWLNLFGFIGTFIVFSSWYSNFYTPDQLFPTLLFLTLFFIIYSISSIIYNLVKKEMSTGIEQLMTLVSGLVYFGLSYKLLNVNYSEFLGLFAMILALYYFLWAYMVRMVTPKDGNLYNFLAFFSIGFISLAIPLQFDGYIITVSWIVEAVLLLVLGAKIKDKSGDIIKVFGVSVYVIALCRLGIKDFELYKDIKYAIVNKYFLTCIFAILGTYVIAYAFKIYAPKDSDQNVSKFTDYKKMVKSFIVMASLITIFAVSSDIIMFHKNYIKRKTTEVAVMNKKIRTERPHDYHEHLVSVDYERINYMRERSQALVSIFLVVYGLMIIAVGFYKDQSALVTLGLMLNTFVIAKFFFYDQWELNTWLRKIIGILSVASAYAVSFLFKVFKNKIQIFEKSKDQISLSRRVVTFFIIVASLVTVFAVSREIQLHHNVLVSEKRAELAEVQSKLNNEYNLSNEEKSKIEVSKQELINEINRIKERSHASQSIFWLFYGFFIMLIGIQRNARYLVTGGLVLNVVVIMKLFLHDMWQLDSYYRTSIAFFTILSAYITSYMFSVYKQQFENDESIQPKKIIALFLVVAHCLTIFAGSRELYLYYHDKAEETKRTIQIVCTTKNQYLKYNSGEESVTAECLEMRKSLEKLNNQSSIAMSLFWVFYALIIVPIGFLRRNKWLRLGGMLLLVVAILKLFFYDLWELGKLYRIISSISLGVVLLTISFAYNKYKHVFKEIVS